ncbi:hypothetical protein MPTK2_7g07440 [Marchantia polymorpha subsp. ruderalis]
MQKARQGTMKVISKQSQAKTKNVDGDVFPARFSEEDFYTSYLLRAQDNPSTFAAPTSARHVVTTINVSTTGRHTLKQSPISNS